MVNGSDLLLPPLIFQENFVHTDLIDIFTFIGEVAVISRVYEGNIGITLDAASLHGPGKHRPSNKSHVRDSIA